MTQVSPPACVSQWGLRVAVSGIAVGSHVSHASSGFSPSLLQDNHDREVQELRRLQRLKELEQKRHSWTAGELGFGRSSSENDVELLTKRGVEDLPPFLHSRPISLSYRPPNTRRSRLSLGITADRELLTFLESSTGSPEELKFHSLPRSCPRQAPASRARMEPGEQRDQGSSPADRPPASEGQEEAPHPTSAWPSQLLAPGPEEPASALPRVRGNGVSILRKRNSEPVGLGPVRSPPLSLLALGIREHELVTGLAQFDLQAAKGPEELAPLTVNDFSPMELASVGDESPQSLGASNGSPTPVGRGAQGGPILAPGDGSAAPDEPISAAPVSEGSSDPENQDPGPLFYVSDTTDCSLTLDCSEGTDSRPEGADPGEGGDGEGSVSSRAGETGGSQVSSNPARNPPAEAPIAASASGGSVSGKSEPGCEGGLPTDRTARGREVMAPKRGPLKQASAGASRAGPARRGAGAAGPVRALTGWESESMRKVVPISRAGRAPPAGKRPPCEAPGGANPPAPVSRRSSVLGPPNASPGRPSTAARPGREPPAPPRSSFRKPSAKPLRNVPRQKPEENKICRSGAQGPDGPEEPPRAPPAPSAPRGPAPVPSFARNTVASSSRCQRTDSPPVARSPGLTRTVLQRQLKVKGGPEDAAPKDSGALRRAGSVRAPRKGPESAEGPGDSAQAPPKGRGAGERASFRLKDACRGALGKGLHPLWK